MKLGVSMSGRRRDPWWDTEGRTLRRSRRARRVLEITVALLSLAVLAWTFAFRTATAQAAASGSVNLDQFATKADAWQNGNLNGNNTAYPEGGIVPFRIAIEGLTKGSHSIHINYDFTAGGHKAYDFLATWNAWVKPGACDTSGGGISTMCPSLPGASSYPFPSDGYVANGLPVKAAEVYSGVSRRLTIWGGTITSISGPVHSGSVNGNSTADYLVTFAANGPAVLLSWGGHLAQSAFWDLAAGGPRDGAGEVSGAPWHMRTLQLDGSGNKNQDRSIQPSAIVGELPPFALAPPTVPPATPRPAQPAQPAGPTPVTAPGDPQPAAPGPGNPPSPPPTAMAAHPRGSSGLAAAIIVALLGLTIGAVTLALSPPRRRRAAPRR
jgi:hypothetical protein